MKTTKEGINAAGWALPCFPRPMLSALFRSVVGQNLSDHRVSYSSMFPHK